MTDAQAAYFTKEAQQEGRKALPDYLPNPPVGCVIVRTGSIIARGYTGKPGHTHAEAMALDVLADDTDCAILFVTLEPCAFQGRTPSCAKRITTTRIKQVYIGIVDPDPRNSGAGIALLERTNINVHMGLLYSLHLSVANCSRIFILHE